MSWVFAFFGPERTQEQLEGLTMGDGPGYDYAYDRARDALGQKRKTQRRRVEKLQEMLREVGFGDYDENLSELEKIATQNLRVTYEILTTLNKE